jgi:hypothetical protein
LTFTTALGAEVAVVAGDDFRVFVAAGRFFDAAGVCKVTDNALLVTDAAGVSAVDCGEVATVVATAASGLTAGGKTTGAKDANVLVPAGGAAAGGALAATTAVLAPRLDFLFAVASVELGTTVEAAVTGALAEATGIEAATGEVTGGTFVSTTDLVSSTTVFAGVDSTWNVATKGAATLTAVFVPRVDFFLGELAGVD